MSTSKSGTRWTPQEDSNLLSESSSGLRILEIAEIHERTTYAIVMRLATLFLQGKDVSVPPESQEFYQGALEVVLRSQEEQKKRRELSAEKRALRAQEITAKITAKVQAKEARWRAKNEILEAKKQVIQAKKQEKIRLKEQRAYLKEEKARLREEKRSIRGKGKRRRTKVVDDSPKVIMSPEEFAAQFDAYLSETIVPKIESLKDLIETRESSHEYLALRIARLGEQIMYAGFDLESFAKKNTVETLW